MQGLGAWNQQGSLSSSGRDADLRSSWLQDNKNLLSSLRGQRKSSQVSCFPQYYFFPQISSTQVHLRSQGAASTAPEPSPPQGLPLSLLARVMRW